MADNKHIGTSFDDLLEEWGIKQEVEQQAFLRIMGIFKAYYSKMSEFILACAKPPYKDSNIESLFETLNKQAKALVKELDLKEDDG